jgi:hypothetical protein
MPLDIGGTRGNGGRPGRRAPIRSVWAHGGGRYATTRWLQVFAIVGMENQPLGARCFALGSSAILPELSLRLPASPGRAVVRGIEPP